MNDFTVTGNADGTFNVQISGVALTVVPYVPPVVVEPIPVDIRPPAPPASPMPVTAVSQTLTATPSTVKVGDTFTVAGMLTMSDGSTKPATAMSLSWFPASMLSNPSGFGRQLTAMAPGDVKITNNNSNTAGVAHVTIVAAGTPPAPPAPPAPSGPPSPPSPAGTPTPPATGDVTLVSKLADGTTSTVTAIKGKRVPLVAGDLTKGCVMYYGDGMCALIENQYMGFKADLVGTFTLKIGDTVLFDGPLTIPPGTSSQPFWIIQPVVNPNADLSMFAKLGPGGESVDMTALYAAADNSPTGHSLWDAHTEDQGERPDLGPLDQYSATYIKNPTAANAKVILGLANASSVYPFHLIDFATGKMVDMSSNPPISMLPAEYGPSNPVVPYTSSTKMSLQQAAAHAPAFCVLAAAVFGTDYHKEQLSLWANYVGSLWQNPLYRLPCGYSSSTHGQCRGKGRALGIVLYASKLSDNPAYFDAWAKAAAKEMGQLWVNQPGIQLDQKDKDECGGLAVSPFQQHVLIEAMGHTLDYGYTDMQPGFDHFATYLLDSMLLTPCELSTIYDLYIVGPDGKIPDDWVSALQLTATHNPALAAALLCAEGSVELQKALNSTNKPGSFIGYPTSPTGYAAMMQPALVAVLKHGTDQVRAKAAWAKFVKYELSQIDYAGVQFKPANPKYNRVP